MNRDCAEQNFLNVKHGLRRLLLSPAVIQISFSHLLQQVAATIWLFVPV